MLLQFSFSNFKSFKFEVSLDITASKVTEYSDHIVELGEEKILPVAAIYGANASGKTNVFEAFNFMVYYIMHSISFGARLDPSPANEELIRPVPYLFDNESSSKPSTFEIYFILPDDTNERTYNYGFSIDKSGVVEEWLNSKAKTSRESRPIFYRTRSELDVKGIPQKLVKNIKVSLNEETLVLSLGALLKVDILEDIVRWFSSIQFGDYGRPQNNLILSSILPQGFDSDENIRKDVIEYLSSFDKSIVGFKVEPIIGDDGKGSGSFMVYSYHRKKGSNEHVQIPLSEESAGTLKMFSLYTQLREVMNTGGVYVIDELNSRLHPLLSRNFILTFLDKSKNKKNAQLIFTTHDTWLLESPLLRRDEIWFTEKDSEGVSSLYSLSDFRDPDGTSIRKDESFEKNYLLGKYGAIPDLGNIYVMED